jgi:hypothetical protein
VDQGVNSATTSLIKCFCVTLSDYTFCSLDNEAAKVMFNGNTIRSLFFNILTGSEKNSSNAFVY